MNGCFSLIQFVIEMLYANLFTKDKRSGLFSPIANVEPQDLGPLIAILVSIKLIISRLGLVLTALRLIWALAVAVSMSYS